MTDSLSFRSNSMALKKGDTVKVYDDPCSCEKLEDIGVLVKQHLDSEFHDMEFWSVRFLSDDMICDRWINKETH